MKKQGRKNCVLEVFCLYDYPNNNGKPMNCQSKLQIKNEKEAI
jgi:hypothetical protein